MQIDFAEFKDLEWKLDMVAVLGGMQHEFDQINNIEPPESYKNIHTTIEKVMNEYQYVVDNYLVSVANLAADLIFNCAEPFGCLGPVSSGRDRYQGKAAFGAGDRDKATLSSSIHDLCL
ncbi:hypothetical protein BpJC7_25600 [Weizmannia acidilactici]|uniref:Uncharacterized protein n=1 Tax=Weizmannia acidilactici TaxID=2607726 RepID=A0A5J4JLJ4_9BACI|nr:hypothetical protein [Weizmannia acidilactici]GER66704.1 hypothetical protein BpJC4_11750 [Weizmannia acidilactici]GER71257.1 hypothetical protein BpJC7_25600 [Weizmannia acidilactici]GER72858.1 hypothetical protein BpPP18_09250 [Weizmannia acidilactici]